MWIETYNLKHAYTYGMALEAKYNIDGKPISNSRSQAFHYG